MKKTALLLSILFLFGCTAVDQPVAESNIAWIKDFDVALDIAKSESKPILIDFYTDWCGWCKKLDKDTYGNAQVQQELEQFVCVKIDAEKNKDLSRKYKISGFPSTAFLKSDGQLIEVVPGYRPPDEFMKILDDILSKI
jgi:thioredoxin-related protein